MNQLRRPHQGGNPAYPVSGTFSCGCRRHFPQAKSPAHLLQIFRFLPGTLLRRAVEDGVGRGDSVRVPSGNLRSPEGIVIGNSFQCLQNRPVAPDTHGQHAPVQGIRRQAISRIIFLAFPGKRIQPDVQIAEARKQQCPFQVKHRILRQRIAPVRGVGTQAGADVAEQIRRIPGVVQHHHGRHLPQGEQPAVDKHGSFHITHPARTGSGRNSSGTQHRGRS